MKKYYISVERLYPVEAEKGEEAITKAHDKISGKGIRSEDLKIVDVVDE